MSDSGSSQFPTRAPASGLSILPVKGEMKAQIIDATGKLIRVDTPRTVVGEVTKVSKDGTVEVRTDDGTLTLKSRDRVVPAEGQRVEVDLQAGAPPRQAVVRPAPQPTQAPQPPTQETSPAPRPAPTVPVQPLPDKPAARPVLNQATQANLNELQAQRPNTTPQPAPTTPQPLPEDAIVRLTPLPASQAKQLVDQIIQLIQMRVMNSATLSTQAIQATLTRELISAIPALPVDTIKNIVQQATTALAAKTPLTNLNEIVNATALTPSIQPTRSPVEGFMRQILTQGTAFAPQPAAALSAQIMMPQANSTLPLTAMTLPTTAKLSLMPLTLPANAPITAPVVPTTMKPGSFMDARVQNFVPVTGNLTPAPAQSAPMILQPTSATTMTAQVVTVTPQQFPVLSLMMPGATDPQLFTLNFPATNLMPGSSLVVMPQPAIPVMPPALPPTAFELLSGFKWPVFDEFLDLQNIQFANATTQSLANILPSPEQPGKIPAAALLFIAAVKAGDLNSWLGEKNIDALRRTGKEEFVTRMMREFSGLNKLSSEPVTPE